jgi:calcium/calmodulin-dependent protein kinase I
MGANNTTLHRESVSKHWAVSKKVLGKGSFATVRKATKKKASSAERKALQDTFPEVVAVKVVEKSKARDEQELALFQDEVEIMHRIDHPNCVRLYEMYDSKEYLMLIVELCTGGELFDRIVNAYESEDGSFSERQASNVIRQTAEGLKYLHTQGVVHRDLKPENLLFQTPDVDSEIKITDFGLAKYTDGPDSSPMTTACGTPGYVAPEVISGATYDHKVDMWSLGVIAYVILCGFPPFYHENHAELFRAIKSCDYAFVSPFWDNVSDSAKDLIQKLLVVDPVKRYSAEQVLEHPWITGKDGAIGEGSLGAHVKDGLRAIMAKEKWRKAQLRLGIIRSLGGKKALQSLSDDAPAAEEKE